MLLAVVWWAGPSLWAPFPLTLALSHGGERGFWVTVWLVGFEGVGGWEHTPAFASLSRPLSLGERGLWGG